jgi:hypothetical protein
MSGIITETDFLSYFPKMDPNNKRGAIQALVVAIYEIGCLLGSILIIGFGDKLGRRRAVLLGVIVMLIGTAIQASSFGIAQLIVGRIVTGVGNGMNTSSIPVWQSEMAPPNIRGFLVLFEGALIAGGSKSNIHLAIFHANQHSNDLLLDKLRFLLRNPIRLLPMALPNRFPSRLRSNPILWHPSPPRIPPLAPVSSLYHLPQNITILTLHFSKHDKDEIAIEILCRLKKAPPNDPSILSEIAHIKKIKQITDGKPLTLAEFYSNGPEMNRWRVTVGAVSQAFQQIGGTNLVTYYATTVFESSLGFSPALSRLLTACYGTLYLAAAVVALFVVDRYGRRKMMIVGSVGMGISALIIVWLLSHFLAFGESMNANVRSGSMSLPNNRHIQSPRLRSNSIHLRLHRLFRSRVARYNMALPRRSNAYSDPR